MKKIIILVITICLSVNTNAQFGGLINKAKNNLADKTENKIENTEIKKNKKEETTSTTTTESNTSNNSVNNTETTSSNNNNNNSQVVTENNNSTPAKKETPPPNWTFYFSNKPFSDNNAGSKTSFKSNEFIYGRLEIPEIVKNYFKIAPKSPSKNTIKYTMFVYKNGEQIGSSNGWSDCFVRTNQLDKNYFNFDVLPEPAKATTVLSPVVEFMYGLASAPLYALIQPAQFPKTDKYKVEITFSNQTFNGYGVAKPEEEWPTCKGTFEFDFNEDDIETLKKNGTTADELVKEDYRKNEREETELPKAWSMESSPCGCGYSEQKIRELIAGWNPKAKIIKLVMWPPRTNNWYIEKNSAGIPLDTYYDQNISFFMSDEDGNCYYVEGLIEKTYTGGGSYGGPIYYRTDKKQVSCDKLKK